MTSLVSLSIREGGYWPMGSSVAVAPWTGRVRGLWVRFTAAHRQRRILGLIALLWMFGAIDLVLTLWADRFTIFYEANPIARAMLAKGMIKSVVLLKLVTLAVASALFWSTRRRRWTEGALWALACAYVVLMFQWSAYTANADELMHCRQMADFAASPMSEDPTTYFAMLRRARQAERASPSHTAVGAPAADAARAASAQPLAFAHAARLTLASSAPASRPPRPWYPW
jgi:hypothetical protein